MNEADIALRSTVYCEKTLLVGFTTVRDLGGTGVNVSLRNAIKSRFIVGPRIYTAEKTIGSTGGHGDPTNGVKKELQGDPGPKEGVINNIDDAIKSATVTASELLRVTDHNGTIEAGKMADLVAVEGNPFLDISLLQDVKFVMKDGTVFKNQK